MGNTNSMNNLQLLDQKNGFKYSAEFLRYSQIPYENGHHLANPNIPHHHFKDQPNQIKVLPDVKFEPRLRPTNNGVLLQSGGTISGRKENENGLQRSKSISESDNFVPPSGIPYVMQRARTQLQISLQPQGRPNLTRNFGSNMDLRMQEVKSLDRLKTREAPKKQKAPPPPVVVATKNKLQPAPKPPNTKPPEKPKQAPTKTESKPKIIGTRLFGDTLKKSHNNEIFNSKNKVLPSVAPTNKNPANRQRSNLNSQDVKKLPPVTRLNPTSFLRRERTFDMSLMQPQKIVENCGKNYSPQLPKKSSFDVSKSRVPAKKQLSNGSAEKTLFQDELKAAAKRRSISSNNSNETKMKTIDRPLKKTTLNVELRKSSSAINGSTLSLAMSQKSNSFKEVNKPAPSPVPESKSPVTENIIEEKEEPIVDLIKQENPKSNFYFGMNDKPSSVNMENDQSYTDDEQMEAINKFAEDIFKMASGGKVMTPNQMSSESALSSDVEDVTDSSDICLKLRPTLPRKQPQIPRFSPVAAWKSLAVETNLNETRTDQILSSSTMHLHLTEETRTEVKIERIIREPSFNMLNSQQDNKSGDSGISAGDVGNTPENNIPPAYLMNSWTPQQDLEDDEESVKQPESIKQSETDDNTPMYCNSGHIFSLSLPRDSHTSHCSSEKTPQNNFYSLQKFKNKVADVFGGVTISTLNDKIQISNYGMDSNWLLSSQPNSIDDFRKMEVEKNQIISHVTSGKHVMYLPSKYEERDVVFKSKIDTNIEEDFRESLQDSIPTDYRGQEEEEIVAPKSKSKNRRFTFQSTIRQVERRKIAEKLSREAEEKEQLRLGELEAMQKVEEEFQKKRAKEKASIRHQLKIFSLEENFGTQPNISHYRNGSNDYYDQNSDDDESVDYIDTKTPYISRIIEMKSSKRVSKVSDCKL